MKKSISSLCVALGMVLAGCGDEMNTLVIDNSCKDLNSCDERCDDECEEGDYACSGDELFKCKRQADGCFKQVVVRTCSAHQLCDAEVGRCIEKEIETCEPECEIGRKACIDNRIAECVMDKQGCAQYEAMLGCREGAVCDEASLRCIELNPCEDECIEGKTMCVGNDVAICEKKAGAKCTSWSDATACVHGEICLPENGSQCGPECGDGSDPTKITALPEKNNKLNLRESSGVSSGILTSIEKGACLTRLDDVNYSGDGCTSGADHYYWYKVSYEGKVGYVCSRLTSAKALDETPVVEPETPLEEETPSMAELVAMVSLDPNYPVKKTVKNISVAKYCASTGECFSYSVYIPDNYRKNMPMIVYLHGMSKRGDDYVKGTSLVLENGIGNEIKSHGYQYDALVVFPQVQTDRHIKEYPKSFVELTDKLSEVFSVDKKRISLMGFSHGCYGVTRYFVKSYPEYYSAVVAIGCANSVKNTEANTKAFRTTPLWTFMGESKDSEGAVAAESDYKATLQYFSEQVNANGGNAKHTAIDGQPHCIVSDSYSILRDKKLNVVDWMLSQSR